MNKQFAKVWVGFTLVFIVLELTYINAKSLNYLSGGLSNIDGMFAIIGSIAFSMVTVLIMMLSKRQWLKIAFPVFDMALVFCGFNLQFADDIMANPIRFYLSIFLGVFTGIITYSLGQINAEQYSNDESKANQIESNRVIEEQKRIIDDLTTKQIESNLIIDELQSNQIESKRIADDSKRMASESRRLASELLPNHILFLNWTNSKRKAENCNGQEAKIKLMAEQIKAGKSITLDEYLKLQSND